MKNRVKFFLALLISIMPFSIVRVALYRVAFGYKIENSKIGFLTIINIKELNISNSSIGYRNTIAGPFSLFLKDKNYIGNSNHFHCGEWVNNRDEFSAKLILNRGASISHNHYFDVSGEICLKESARVAGRDSQFWTHGGFKEDVDINIGKNCYIGSAVRFAPGASVGDDSLVAMGSVVSSRFDEKNILIGGVPAKVVKRDINWKENWV